VKKLLFLGVGIILLVVVAAVGMSLIGGGAKDEEEVAEVEVEEHVEPTETVEYEMRPMSVPIVSNNKVKRYVIMSAKYELVARPDQAARAEEDRPLLRDAIVRSVHANPLRLREDGSIDLRDLNARFLQSARDVFHSDIAQRVDVGEAKAGRPAPPGAAKPPPKKKSSGH
jgi:hypothetical protein